MKCKSCGQDISRRAVFCSNCGSEIKENYHAVDEAIISSASRVNVKILRIVCIAFTIALAIGFFILCKNSYKIGNAEYEYEYSDKYAKAHIDELNALLESRDYFAIDRYYKKYNIYFDYSENKTLRYNEMGSAAYYVKGIAYIAMESKFDSTSYITKEGSLLASYVTNLYSFEEALSGDEDGSMGKEFVNDAIADANMLLKVYFYVDDESLTELKTLSLAERTVFFDKVLKEAFSE